MLRQIRVSYLPRAISRRRSLTDSTRPQPGERFPRYRINRSDILNLSFPLSPEFNQNRDGAARMDSSLCKARKSQNPRADRAGDQRCNQKAYARILHEPIIDVDLKDFQKAYFIVTGQVSKPGQYDLRYDLTASEAIAVAGGFMPTAKTRVYLYHRSTDGWVQARELKLKDFLHGKNVNEDAQIRSGDMIFVPEKTITKVRKIQYPTGWRASRHIPAELLSSIQKRSKGNSHGWQRNSDQD